MILLAWVETNYGGIAKNKILKDADKIEIEDAISELIDNAIEHYPESGESLAIGISVRKENGQCVVEFLQNSGGVPEENYEALFTAGISAATESELGGISTYGQGFGLAVPALGRFNTIYNWHSGQNPIVWQLGAEDDPDQDRGGNPRDPRNYYFPENKDWSPPAWDLDDTMKSVELGLCVEGHLRIVFKRTPKKVEDYFTDTDRYISGIQQICKIYTRRIQLLQDKGTDVSIQFNNDLVANKKLKSIDISSYVSEESIFFGDFDEIIQRSPVSVFSEQSVRLTIQYSVGNSEALDSNIIDIDILLVPADGSSDKQKAASFMMWGNDRLFCEDYRPPSLNSSVGKADSSLTKISPDATTKRWKGFVHFTSKNTGLIPWNGPIKWGFKSDVGNDVVKKMNEILRKLGKSFAGKGHYSPNMLDVNNPPKNSRLKWEIRILDERLGEEE